MLPLPARERKVEVLAASKMLGIQLKALESCDFAVLQFVLVGIMPRTYSLIPPYYLLLVSYVYIFGLVGLAICTNKLANQWRRHIK